MTCRLFHDWGIWGETKMAHLGDRKRLWLDNYLIQERTCNRCGKLSWRRV